MLLGRCPFSVVMVMVKNMIRRSLEMANTALRAKKTHTVTFKNKEQEEFYLKDNPKMEDIYAKNKTSRNNK